jgi:hypothetical protein
VEAWLAYKATRPVCGGDYIARCRRIELQNQKLEWDISQLQRQYVKLTDVKEWGDELASKVRSIVSGSLTKLAPELRLCSVPDADSKLRDAGDKILRQLNAFGNG